MARSTAQQGSRSSPGGGGAWTSCAPRPRAVRVWRRGGWAAVAMRCGVGGSPTPLLLLPTRLLLSHSLTRQACTSAWRCCCCRRLCTEVRLCRESHGGSCDSALLPRCHNCTPPQASATLHCAPHNTLHTATLRSAGVCGGQGVPPRQPSLCHAGHLDLLSRGRADSTPGGRVCVWRGMLGCAAGVC